MQVVLLEDPVTSEAKMQAGGTKQVCNAKVASGEPRQGFQVLNPSIWPFQWLNPFLAENCTLI